MVRANVVLTVGLCGLLASLCGIGCGGTRKAPPQPPEAQNLREICWAYVRASSDLGHPPRSKEELLPYFNVPREPDQENPDKPFKEVDPAVVFRSPNDDQEYVIDWGFDLREMDRNPNAWPVIAYERYGKDGKRFVMQGRYVRLVTDEQLADLPFPEDFKRP